MSKTAFVIMAILVGCAGWAYADVAATVDPSHSGFSAGRNADLADPTHTDYQTIGWRFFVDKPIRITHLGLFDYGDNGLSRAHTMGIWRVKKEGGLQLELQVDIGPGGVAEGHHVWVALPDPFTINPDPIPYYINGTPYYERWLVGVWTGSGNTEELVLYPMDAVTLDAAQAGVIRFQNYTFRLGVTALPGPAPYYGAPWGNLMYYNHFGVNFKYDLVGPKALAGDSRHPDDPCDIYTSEQTLTTIWGTATHTVSSTPVRYRWLEGSTVLQDWTSPGPNGEANLSLAAPVAALAIGAHTLTLEVTDETLTVSDSMILTIANTPPDATPAPKTQTVNDTAVVLIAAEFADFDGDELSYEWRDGLTVLASGVVTPPQGGGSVAIEDLLFEPGVLAPGQHSFSLVVSDGVNPAITETVAVAVVDTTMPTLAPMPDFTMLWPANHALHSLRILANASDNSSDPITLDARVESSEPDDGSGDATTEVDCSVESIDQQTGVIYLKLRAERSGTGDGRVYTIRITATDSSNNQSSADVEIRVPHDRRKK